MSFLAMERNVQIDRNLHVLLDRIQIQRWRDNGLAVCKANPEEIENAKKEFSNVFKVIPLK